MSRDQAVPSSATLVPTHPGFSGAAERAVWDRLREGLGPHDALIAGARFTDRHGDHEGDLIVALADHGIAVIEVKGGRVEHNGTDWVQHGGTSKTINPVGQARRVKYALRDFLDDSPHWDRHRVRMAHLIALPYSAIPRGLSLPDCPRWMVLDKNDLAGGPVTALRRALDALDTELSPPSSADVAAMVASLQPTLPPSPAGGPPARRRRRAGVVVGALAGVALVAAGVAGVQWWQSRPQPEPAVGVVGGADQRFDTCLEAKAAGFGYYQRDRDPEYYWYRDTDGDGIACE